MSIASGEWQLDCMLGWGRLSQPDEAGLVYSLLLTPYLPRFNRFKYVQVEVYEGETLGGDQSGRGVCWRTDGSVYVVAAAAAAVAAAADDAVCSYCGHWAEHTPDGIGCLISSDGSGFKGQWCKGMQHGLGHSISYDGDVYIGNFYAGYASKQQKLKP
jgi:hypothetical protein